MRFTLSSVLTFLSLALLNGIAGASISLYTWPNLVYTGKTYTISWGGGDGTTVTLSLLLKDSSGTLNNLGVLWTGTGSSIYWTVGTALKASNYYAIKISQNGVVNYSDYFSLLVSTSSGTTITSSISSLSSASTIKGTSPSIYTSVSTQISSIETTVTQVSTFTPTSISSDSPSTLSAPYSGSQLSLIASTTSSSTSTGTLSPDPAPQTSHGKIIGIIIGVIVLVAAIVIAAVVLVRRSFRKQDTYPTPEKPQFIPPSNTPGPAAPTPTTILTGMGPGLASAAAPTHQQQHSGPGPAMHDQYPNQYDPQQQQQQQQQQQPYPPQSYQQQQQFQAQAPYPPQPHQYQSFQQQQPQQQAQGYAHQFPVPPSHHMGQQQQQQYQPFQPQQQYPQPYHQTYAAEGHELAAMDDVKRPELLGNQSPSAAAPTNMMSPISPISSHGTIQRQGTFSDIGSEMDGSIPPRYESAIAMPPIPVQGQGQGQQSFSMPPSQQQTGQQHGQHGIVHELG